MNKNTIPLFYWSERRFVSRKRENYGDLLSKYLVEKISGREVKFVHPKKQPWWKFKKKHYLGIGSILQHASKNSIVWGSGIIDIIQPVAKADFRAVRGPKTRDYLISVGYDCPEIYGDPAILLPKFYNPKVGKEFKLGIVPHYKDFEIAKELYASFPGVKVIDLLTLDVERTTREIMSCDYTISSSLHGLIVSHVYGIPSLWVKFSDYIFGDGIKYDDYLSSMNMEVYTPLYIKESISPDKIIGLVRDNTELPNLEKLNRMQEELLDNCPFNSSYN
ncbi:polysaccharide pyruvyl transferase family protein [Christiangramia echinicola]|uniref:Polysaccharide pyruvyl transferase n=1 Tax=Christiangramia echinicola TaxID=279359 RepID=A0A1H1L4X3_9FLAO|nr:polysaccharide pyruvyl transferase family protein [Christiangramia echinicola]SDR69437.1 Polysaccharide pyruvyl transferase [Christiangramia echinicola]